MPGLARCLLSTALVLAMLLTGGSRVASAQLRDVQRAVARPRQLADVSRPTFTVGHTRQSHVLVGLLGGLVVGAAAGAIVGNNNAKHCHAESCQVSAALGGGFDVVVGGLGGAVVGAVAGAVWPVR